MDIRAYLLDQKLQTETPYEQENLHPKERFWCKEPVEFENFYRVKSEKIFCHICGAHRHNNGITGILESGTRILFGSKCATEFFGPEVMKRCAGDLRRKTKNALNRFTILKISHSMDNVEAWLRSYQHLVRHIDIAWHDIEIRYPKPYSEIMGHLQKNQGRILRVTTQTTEGKALKAYTQENTQILTAVRFPEAIKFLKQGQQQISLVRVFAEAVKSIRTEPSEQMFNNLAKKYRDALQAAKTADAIIVFTASFFSPDKLSTISQWYEERRESRLADKNQITKQDIGERFSKIMGTGVEIPRSSLALAMVSTKIESQLYERQKLKRSNANL